MSYGGAIRAEENMASTARITQSYKGDKKASDVKRQE